MTRSRQEQLLELLVEEPGWATAAGLADRLGVTARSVRSYVVAINARSRGGDAVESGPRGYRMRRNDVALAEDSLPERPAHRQRRIIATLLAHEDGADIHDLAAENFVSSATVDADLARIRQLIRSDELTLRRAGTVVRLDGSEVARRRLIASVVQDDSALGYDPVALRLLCGPRAPEEVAGLRRDVASALAAADGFVNEIALNGLALRATIAAGRVHAGKELPGADAAQQPPTHAADVVADLVQTRFDVRLSAAERSQIDAMVTARGGFAPARESADPLIAAAVRDAVREASTHFGVDGLDDDFLERLSLHVQRLAKRAQSGEWSPNPLTRSLKSAYPLLFEVAVAVAHTLSERLGIEVRDDEVAYLALHIGGQWERSRTLAARPSAVLVSPGYYELVGLLRGNIERALGSQLHLRDVHSEAAVDWRALDADIILTTVAPPVPLENVVRISPFLTDLDIERVGLVVARVRRARRLAQLRAELGQYFVPGAFLRGIDARAGEEEIIRMLGARLVEAGVIDADYVDSVVQRERASSTAFTDTLAVPHAMGMTAQRTAIAIGLAESSVAWGDGRVQVIALVGFSENDRAAFQTVFEQFVEVFADPDSAQRLVRKGVDQASFVAELAAIIDD